MADPNSGSFYRRRGKRIFDVLGAGSALIVLSPVFAVATVLVKATSRGPVFFAQERPGLHGKSFRILKFRSMLIFEDSYSDDGKELSNDERVTKVGRVLRRMSVDELPQLFNMVRGDMSIVGPRPALSYQVERYDAEQMKRLEVRPGLTGLAQVSGRNSLSWEEKIALDLEYVETLSFANDLRIIGRTFGVVLGGSGLRFEKYDALSQHDGNLREHIGERRDVTA